MLATEGAFAGERVRACTWRGPSTPSRALNHREAALTAAGRPAGISSIYGYSPRTPVASATRPTATAYAPCLKSTL